MMPELWMHCPQCKGTASYETRLERSCETCNDSGFVRYGTERGHAHVWQTDAQPLQDTKGWWQSNGVMRARNVECACGKTAEEMLP